MSRTPASKQYTGHLTAAQAAAGIHAAMRTAYGLVRDAELLLKNERWERATALAILAVEEAGKVAILRSILLARNETELQTEWRAYRSHTKKNVGWIFLKLVGTGARKLEDFRPIFDTGSDHGKIIDALKQECFYSHIADEGEWFSPDQRIDSEMAKSMFTVARSLAKQGPSPMTTEAELELWVKHLGPVWKGPMADMKKALVACYAEAEAKGILQGTRDTAMTGMLSFLGEDVFSPTQ